ncbi:PAS domain S-box-containing protein [Nitrosomonas marina]|uniref:Sensory/regulatory protein RpfC n=2 Tax=Nitrosomonas marina TaxID=917 RepID=A0A1I0G4X5_9PROT|nr:PAS domain S-box-containing protein [Nitrosomonas marina]
MLLVVLVYATCAYLTKLFNFLDYYNLFAGIPAGLAFAIFIIWGTRLWQFIWASTFTVDFIHNLSQFHDVESITIHIIAAFFTASASVLQALIGAHFARPYLRSSNQYLDIVKIWALLFKIGPIACLISTTIDTFVLYQFNGLYGNAIMLSWISNYALDILGIFALTPIVVFYSQSNVFFGNGWRRRISIIIYSLLGTASLLIAGLFLMNHDVDRNSHFTFKEKSNEIILYANNLIKASENRLRSIGALVKSNEKLNLSEFVSFNQNIETQKCHITFSWILNEGFNKESGVFSHQFIYPEDHMDNLYGKNIAEQVPRQALHDSMKTGRLALAKSINSDRHVWWLIHPVFADGPLDANQFNTNKLLGFAAAQINMLFFFEDLSSKADDLNVALRITAIASWNSSTTILEHKIPAQLAPDLTDQLKSIFANKGLQIEMWNLHDNGLIWQTGPIVLLFFGIILMMLITAYSLNTMGYSFYLERKISVRTRDIELQSAKTNALVNHLKDVVLTMDKNGIVLSANPAINTILGYTGKEVVGSSISFLIPEMLCSEHNCWLHTRDTKSIEFEKETKAQHKNGHFLPVQLFINEYVVKDERYFSGVLHDLSAHKKLVSDVEAARDKAEAASQAKSEFLAKMSHEIRTPMNGVIGMLEVLTQSSLQPDQIEVTTIAKESATALLDIINDILDFSKIEAGKLQLTNELFSIEKETEKVCALLDRIADQKNVELLFFVDPEIPGQLHGDALRIRQILYNLISNAIKFSSKLKRQGSVFVHIKLDSSNQDQLWLQCEVCDNGIGMSEEIQSQLFNAFQQGEASTTRRFGGTGLGLAISRQLAHMMGGGVNVRSKLNEGSTFYLRLPFQKRSPTKLNECESKFLADLSCVTIGSKDGFISYIGHYLSHAGAHVQHANCINDINLCDTTISGKPWVWLLDAKVDFSFGLLHTIISQYSQQNIRIVVIGRGRRRKPRCLGDNLFLIDANVLTRKNLLHTVALAADLIQDIESVNDNIICKPVTETTDLGNYLYLDSPILVAEDNEINQKVIQRQLCLLGVKADIAEDGREALRLWKINKYAMLLTDIHMPHIDGYQLTATIREEEAKANKNQIPIIALTANALKDEAEHCKNIGMDDYLSKPVQLSVLKEKIKKWQNPSKIKMEKSLKNSEVASNPEAASIDVNVLRELVGDDQAVIYEMLSEFLTSAAKIEREIQLACEASDCEQATRAAHKLKSSARSVGALRLGDICQQIEQAGKNGKTKLLKDLYTKFKLEMVYVNNNLISLNETVQ